MLTLNVNDRIQFGNNKKMGNKSPSFSNKKEDIPQKQFQQNAQEDPIVKYEGNASFEKSMQYDIDKELALLVRGKYKCLKLDSKAGQIFPVMLSLKTEQMKVNGDNAKEEEIKKPPVDLICVIDVSGSMSGEKIDLVRKTLLLLLEFLTEQDRLCLIEFDDKANRLTPLARLSPENIKNMFPKAINNLRDRGGTNVALGMQVAFEAIKFRQQRNPVTSVFLLSDGLDGGAQTRVQNHLNKMNLSESETFTIHTFGFGKDHDSKLMTDIAKLKNGNFYYIEQVNKVDECFIDALAGLVSVVAQNVTLKVKPTFKQPFSDVKVTKYFGQMWQNVDNEQTVKITNLLSGVQKDFLLEISLPPMNFKVGDMERNAQFLEISLSAQTVDFSRTITKLQTLDVTFYNEDEEVPNFEEDPDVMFNYLRVHAAESMKDARQMAEKGQYEQAEKLMDQVLGDFQSSQKVDQTKLEVLRQDVTQTKNLCKPQVYQQGGQHQMMQMEECWMEQKSKGIKFSSNAHDMYENNVQSSMKRKVLTRKGL